MNSTSAPAGRHVHLDFDVDREHRFHYRSAGRDGHRIVLHHGDTITFTSGMIFRLNSEKDRLSRREFSIPAMRSLPVT